MIKKSRRYLSLMLAGTILFSNMISTVKVSAETLSGEEKQEVTSEELGYEIYPKPQSITYKDSEFIIRKNVNVVYENGIDDPTKNRLKEVLHLKDLNISESNSIVKGKTNILVGIKDSGQYVDKYSEKYKLTNTELFNKTDSYLLAVDDDVITVLGKDTDASFYGLTTLYHIFKQIDEYTIRNFIIEDYADVVSRGFIEGYYGNPWSTKDRVNLMKWGGYYKLNSYFYAPKDDAKHRLQWDQLYTNEELNNKIKPLAQAGNESKTRFVYALHPFPHGNNFRFNENYDKDLEKLKNKFKQVIDCGVRQIAILADDFWNPGGNNGERLMKDIVKWLNEEVKIQYPDMKTTVPYVPYDYMGNGGSKELQILKNFNEKDVQLVMTGGKVWGEVSNAFTETFYKNTGHGPYMWINWPCTDNSKKHLIMGGYKNFLHPGVNPEKIQGIVLNPMQQSEPSKVAIFGNACYSWNIWSKEEADQAWEDSFKYVDHNSAIETEASNALKELSKHMINQAMDGRVVKLEESVKLKEQLNSFKEKMNNDKVTINDIDPLIKEFTLLQDASRIYRASADNTALKDQIVYWLDCWDDTTESAIAYLEGIKAIINGDGNTAINKNTQGKTAFDRSKTHGFHYVNHTEYAEVGVQHIVPFIKKMSSYLSNKTLEILDPTLVIKTFITNRTDSPTGDINNVFDGKDNTNLSYRNPVWIYKDDYVGVKFSKKISINDIRFLLGNGKNHIENAKLQYTENGVDWKDIQLVGKENNFKGIENKWQDIIIKKENLPENFEAMGVRLIATENNTKDSYLDIHEIAINKKENEKSEISYTIQRTNRWTIHEGSEANLYDGNDSTYVWYDPDGPSNSTNDDFLVDDFLGYDLGKVAKLESIHIAVGKNGSSDKLKKYNIETSINGTTWETVKEVIGKDSGQDIIDLNLDGKEARYVRIVNKQRQDSWGIFSAFTVKEKKESNNVYTNKDSNIISNNEIEGKVSLIGDNISLSKDEYIGIKLDNIKEIISIEPVNIPKGAILETSLNGLEWRTYVNKNSEKLYARYIRIINPMDNPVEVNVNDIKVTYRYVGSYGVESDFGNGDKERDIRTNGKVNNVFDGDLGTFGTITGSQDEGKNITFDLGQSIDFESIRYYINENSKDFLRHAKFEVSNDKKDWKEVLIVGKPTENVLNDDIAKTQDYLTHDTQNPGNMYQEKTGLNGINGRYLRITPLTTYSHRWVDFGEIQINGGKYISKESNYDVITEHIEEPGKLPSNMLDKDFSTTYKSSEKNSRFTYNISEPNDKIKSLRIIQEGEVSKATVYGRFENSSDTFIKLGTLSQTINEFKVDINKGNLLEVKVEWEDIIPEISEIMLLTIGEDSVNKEVLQKELDDYNCLDTWTLKSQKLYNLARSNAEEIIKSEYISQISVDSAYGMLVSARQSAVLKATNIDELQKIVDNKINNEEKIYTNSTYRVYEVAYNKIENALSDVENISIEKANELLTNVQLSIENLRYSSRNRELAEFLLEEEPTLKSENYTSNSWNNFITAKETLISAIANDKVDLIKERINPLEMKRLSDEYIKSIESLVDVSGLKTFINEFENMDESIYTTESFEKYKMEIEKAKRLLKNGTTKEVEDSILSIEIAKKDLVLNESINIKDVIKDAEKVLKDGEGKYTTLSYNLLKEAVDAAKNANDADDKEALAKNITEAKANLVDISSLKALVDEVIILDSNKYTTTSYNILKDSLKDINQLYYNGTNKDVQSASNKIDEARRKLVLRISDEKYNEYFNSIVLEDSNKYTVDSYKLYYDAYKALKNLNLSDTSYELFITLKSEFEEAKANLIFINDNGNNEDKNNNSDTLPETGENSAVNLGLLALLITGAGILLIRKR